MIVGGSFVMSLYIGKQKIKDNDTVMWDDIDIIVPVFNPTSSKFDCDIIDLKKEAQLLKSIFGTEIKIHHRTQSEFYNEKGEPLSVVTGEISEEQFDELIVGTVNTVYNGHKFQFVFVNQCEKDIVSYYASVSDLPVFSIIEKIVDDKEPASYFEEKFYIKNESDAEDAMRGILNTLNHTKRREKYTKKGFVCKIPKY